jgi:hypothetical protein
MLEHCEGAAPRSSENVSDHLQDVEARDKPKGNGSKCYFANNSGSVTIRQGTRTSKCDKTSMILLKV